MWERGRAAEKEGRSEGEGFGRYTNRRLTWGPKGVCRACESPNGTHASFDKLSEHMYVVMSHSNLAIRTILRNAPFTAYALAIVIYIAFVAPNETTVKARRLKQKALRNGCDDYIPRTMSRAVRRINNLLNLSVHDERKRAIGGTRDSGKTETSL